MSLISTILGKQSPDDTPRAAPPLPEVTRDASHLEAILFEMDRWGAVKLFRMKQGWHVAIDVAIPLSGVKFEVMSSFVHATPLEAAQECRVRLMDAIRSVNAQEGKS